MHLSDYFDRIGHRGSAAPTLANLRAVHRAQAYSIPYDGLDIQFGRPVDLDPQRIFYKLVTQKRGGWCYETNGLLQWALSSMGFSVMRATAGVHRKLRGDSALGNHLTLLVRCDDQTYLADLGLGDGLREPVPLVEGVHLDGPLQFRLEVLPDGFWRFHNHGYGSPETFDFRAEPADESVLCAKSAQLQSDPASHFVLNAECIVMREASSICLLGRVFRQSSDAGTEKTLLLSADEMTAALAQHFGIVDLPIHTIWREIEARHTMLFGDQDFVANLASQT